MILAEASSLINSERKGEVKQGKACISLPFDKYTNNWVNKDRIFFQVIPHDDHLSFITFQNYGCNAAKTFLTWQDRKSLYDTKC